MKYRVISNGETMGVFLNAAQAINLNDQFIRAGQPSEIVIESEPETENRIEEIKSENAELKYMHNNQIELIKDIEKEMGTWVDKCCAMEIEVERLKKRNADLFHENEILVDFRKDVFEITNCENCESALHEIDTFKDAYWTVEETTESLKEFNDACWDHDIDDVFELRHVLSDIDELMETAREIDCYNLQDIRRTLETSGKLWDDIMEITDTTEIESALEFIRDAVVDAEIATVQRNEYEKRVNELEKMVKDINVLKDETESILEITEIDMESLKAENRHQERVINRLVDALRFKGFSYIQIAEIINE